MKLKNIKEKYVVMAAIWLAGFIIALQFTAAVIWPGYKNQTGEPLQIKNVLYSYGYIMASSSPDSAPFYLNGTEIAPAISEDPNAYETYKIRDGDIISIKPGTSVKTGSGVYLNKTESTFGSYDTYIISVTEDK